MKKNYTNLPLIIFILIYIISCEFGIQDESLDPSNLTTVEGQVVDATTGNWISNASVIIVYDSVETGTSTDSKGFFSKDFYISSDGEITIITNKAGYELDTTKIFITVGTKTRTSLIELSSDDTIASDSSGSAASLYLFSQSHQSIGVKESGGVEACQIVFEVLDSSGVPITQENWVIVKFSFLSNPGGVEYLFPDSSITNAFVRASVTLNSGTAAGVIQILATIQLANNIIQTHPVLISIHGGLPDQNHFDVASEFMNYPAYGTLGYVVPFTAYVGDKFSNPVRPNTSVYFSTSSGIIEGSALTSEIGTATVNLLSQPFPDHQVYGPGFLEVIASTIDENSEMIYTSSVRLLSGFPIILVIPTFIDIQNEGSQAFTFTVSDGNNNPLAKGNSISVTVEEGNISLLGDIDIILPDTQSESFTQFSFTAFDSEPDTLNPVNAVIKIQSTGSNGNESINIYGTSR
jgi:hypothetical protein